MGEEKINKERHLESETDSHVICEIEKGDEEKKRKET